MKNAVWDWLRQDARFALRSFRRTPGYFAVAVLSLALGIGANMAVFSVFDAIFLRPLPYDDPAELVMLWETTPGGGTTTVSPGNYEAWRSRSTAFVEMAAFNIHYPVLRGEGEADRLMGSVVAPHFFDILGIRPALGSGFRPEHARPGGEAVALLSHSLWRARFGADPDVVGRTILLDDEPHIVLGVLPEGYRHPEPDHANTQIWLPLALGDLASSHRYRFLRVLARLREDVAVDRAGAEMGLIAAALAEEVPAHNEGYGARMVPLDQEIYGDARPGMLLLLGSAGFVLLIVCVNVANLMLVRSQRRGREFAVRAAVGGGRRRLAAQVLMEAVLIALAGGALGALLVFVSADLLRHLQAEHVSWFADLRMDGGVLLFMFVVTAVTALAFGLVPALRSSRPELREVLVDGARSGGGPGGRRAREWLIVAELALTATLLVSTALLGRSFLRLTGAGIGFTTNGVLTLEMELPVAGYPAERVAPAQEEILDRVRAVAGVTAAAVVSDLPFTPWNMFTGFSTEGPPEPDASVPTAEWRTVSDDYFSVLGIPRRQGGLPAPAERAGGREAVVVNEAMVRGFFGGRDPIGSEVHLGSAGNARAAVVTGVVGDVLDDGFDSMPEARFYRSHEAAPRRWVFLAASTTLDPATIAPAVRRAITAYDPDIAVTGVLPLSTLVDVTVAGRRLMLGVVLAFGALALILAAIGIYGVVSFGVGERTAEMAVRTALGAGRADVVALVLRQSLAMAGLGLAIGFGLGLIAARLIRGLLFGVGSADPLSYLTVVLVLGGTAILAAWVPARRAAAVAPMDALRMGG